MGEKSAANLLAAIDQEQPDDAAAAAQRARHPRGRRGTALALARHFGTLAALMAADEARIQQVPDVGPIVAAHVAAFFASAEHRRVIKALRRKRCDVA